MSGGALRSDATALDAVVALMGPEGGPGGPHRRYVVLPSARHPRYVVPATGRATFGLRLRPGTTRADAAQRWAARGVLRLGGGRLLHGAVEVPDGTRAAPGLRRHLARLLGVNQAEMEVAVALGAPRPNRKPVVQVLAPSGATRAWAKLGVDALTDALVAHETKALALRPEAPVVAPSVVASSSWHGHPLLVLNHMEMEETEGPLVLTAETLAAIAGPPTYEPVSTSAWWATLCQEARADANPRGAVELRVADLGRRLDSRRWPFGRWHGDLAPWNAAWRGDQLQVWDWERSDGPVPCGLDAVHNVIQVALLRHRQSLDSAVTAARRDAAPLLVALGHAADDVDLVVDAYLSVLRVRLAGDARLGRLGTVTPVAAALDAASPGARPT